MYNNYRNHDYNVERRISERFFAVEPDKIYNDDEVSQNSNDSIGFDRQGEITGEFFDTVSLEKGMPMRPKTITYETEQLYNNSFLINSHLDFDLYDKKPTKKVSYSNSSNSGYASISSIGNILTKKTKNTDLSIPYNKYSFSFYTNFVKVLKSNKPLFLSTYTIYSLFAMLYFGSKNKTENILIEEFNFMSKSSVYNFLQQINSTLDNSPYFKKTNIYFVRDDILLNDAYKTYIKPIGHFIRYNHNNTEDATVMLNDLIKKSTKGCVKNIVTHDIIAKKPTLLACSTLYIDVILIHGFSEKLTVSKQFNGITSRIVSMMRKYNSMHKYFEDNRGQIIELDFIDDNLAFGVILQNSNVSINIDKLFYYISHLNPTPINYIELPKFTQDSKYKIDNMFKKSMPELFSNLEINDIVTNNKTKLGDIITASVIVVKESNNIPLQPEIIKSKINFIANKQFIYYIRHKQSNLILSLGHYC